MVIFMNEGYKLKEIIALRAAKTVFRDGKYAIKVFDGEYAKSDILNEALNTARIEETGLPVPRLVEVTRIDGKWAIVSEFIEGKSLEELWREHPEKEEEYLSLLVDLQMRVHEARSPLLVRLRDKMHRKISLSGLDATTRYDLHTRLEGMPRHAKVCHGDLTPSNIIITPEGLPFILDWAHATQGNASADVARTYLLFCLEGKEELAKKYMRLFCEKSDTARQYVEAWLPIVAASQSVKGKSEERELLLKWVDVVDFE